MALSLALARALAEGRSQFNTRVVEAKRRYPSLDTAAFGAFLQIAVDPLINSVASVAPERTAAVTAIAYDIALDLVGQGFAGAGTRSLLLDRAWRVVTPQYARLIADRPLEVLGNLTNALIHVEKMQPRRAGEWLQRMHDLAPHAQSVGHLRALGQIAAWRSGLAHFREGAIRVAAELPAPAALAAIGAPAEMQWATVHDQLLANPWWQPGGDGASPITLGAFSGFGGAFKAPPELRALGANFVVKSGEHYNLLVADGCGAILLPASIEDFRLGTASQAPTMHGTALIIGTRRIEIDLPAAGLAVALSTHTIAVTSPYTFAVQLYPQL